MSRWVNIFNEHKFRETFQTTKNLIDKIPLGKIIEPNILAEISRIKKVVNTMEHCLQLVEPEIVAALNAKLNNINDFLNSTNTDLNNFITNYNSIGYIQNANNNFDSVIGQIYSLFVIRPELNTKDSISEMLKTYNNVLAESLKEIDMGTLKKNSEEIRKLKILLLNDTTEEKSIKTQIDDTFKDITKIKKEIDDYYELQFNENNESSTKKLIQKAKDEIIKNEDDASKKLIELEKKIAEYEKYYVLVFGEADDEGLRKGGLKDEVNILSTSLKKFAKDSEIEFTTLYSKIEDLIPGATSAGLAKAYQDERKTFKFPIIFWNTMFAMTLVLMTTISYESFIQLKNLQDIPFELLHKLPLYGPLIWFAIYASKRRSENQRLEQEYAHKEALAKSYSSYKLQIEGLKKETEVDKLMSKLLDSSIDTVSKNASESLDKKHGDKMPSIEVIEKSIEKLISFKETLNKVKN